jgi:hypothetical protein
LLEFRHYPRVANALVAGPERKTCPWCRLPMQCNPLNQTAFIGRHYEAEFDRQSRIETASHPLQSAVAGLADPMMTSPGNDR